MHDERSGTQQAKLLFEKGFDNVYLLSGGVEGFLETNYDMVEGTNVPEKPKTATTAAKKKTTTQGFEMIST
jgi:3-mercaptopyruvate sulfurtransferase SseA